jgi:hypothetical protein
MNKKRKTSKPDNIEDEILETKLRIEQKKRELKDWEDHLQALERQREVLMSLVVKG